MKVFNPYLKTGYIIYTCPYGATLKGVGRLFNVPEKKLAEANKIEGVLSVKDELIINTGNVIKYRVEAGDTEDSISEKFGINKQEFLKYNYIECVYPGQTVYVDLHDDN